MALNHWHPDAAIAFSQHLETQVRAFLSRVCLTAVSHGGVCGGARVSQCGVCQDGWGGVDRMRRSVSMAAGGG